MSRNIKGPLDRTAWNTLDDVLTAQIIGYLPIAINADVQRRFASWAVKKIVNAVRTHRVRMNIRMDHELPLSITAMRAHYILHYPDDDRLEYLRIAMLHLSTIDRRVEVLSQAEFADLIANSTPIKESQIKRLFRAVISSMTAEELAQCGW